jgi:predicted glutamine amidotransferase
MCRLVGWISEEPVTLRDVLGEAALARLVDLSAIHGHGWGFGYLDPGTGVLSARRSTLAARFDPDFAAAAAGLATTRGLVHLRWATPGFGHSLADTHPFVRDGWAMIHNGAIGPTRRVGALLDGSGPRRANGTTDSEHLFLAVLEYLDRSGGRDGTDAASVGADIAAAIEAVSDRAHEAGIVASSLNSMLLGPSGMYMLNWHDTTQVPPIMLDAAEADDPDTPPYYDLRHRHGEGLDVIASSGFVDDPGAWTSMPNASLLSMGFDGKHTLHTIRPRHPLCPVPDDGDGGADAAADSDPLAGQRLAGSCRSGGA